MRRDARRRANFFFPFAMRREVEDEAAQKERTDVAPSLSPEAKDALLSAYRESRELGASYVGPEHVLLALAADEQSEAGRLLRRFGLSHTKLRGAVIRGVEEAAGLLREREVHGHDVRREREGVDRLRARHADANRI